VWKGHPLTSPLTVRVLCGLGKPKKAFKGRRAQKDMKMGKSYIHGSEAKDLGRGGGKCNKAKPPQREGGKLRVIGKPGRREGACHSPNCRSGRVKYKKSISEKRRKWRISTGPGTLTTATRDEGGKT